MDPSVEESKREVSLTLFSQTLQTPMASSTTEASIDQVFPGHNPGKSQMAERTHWVLNAPVPPGPWRELVDSIGKTGKKFQVLREQPMSKNVASILKAIFPILVWGKDYKITKFKKDLLAGLTLASLCIPQSIGYATLAKLDPQYGLYTSVVPPLIYALMGSSREIAIGPVAVVSLLLSSMIQKLEDPVANPIAYRRIVFTVTFFAGIFQAAFGLLRLGFLVDFLSHAAIVGFMAGAAIVIGLQQLKGLLGITHFTNKTDIISVLKAVWRSIPHPWNYHNFILGCSFLSFILIMRFLGRRNKKLFWLSAIAPLISIVLSTLIVFLTRADQHGVKILKHIKGGLNPSSVHQLQFDSPHATEVVKSGIVVAVVALTEAIAVGRSFASIKGYHLNGNQEMVAMGFMNIAGSLTSSYVATGSFSRTAVNFSAGCETVVSNLVMVITVIISLELLTRLLYYTPTAILASIILSALPGLIDLNEAYNIWRVDKLDFLACIGAFLGVLFASVEIGLIVAVSISFAKIILSSIQSGMETLGRLPGTDMFCDVKQYPMALKTPGVLITRVKSSLLCFANANVVRERILKWVTDEQEVDAKGNVEGRIQLVVIDMSNLMNIDTSGMASLEELHAKLASLGIELAIANPKWQVIEKIRLCNLVDKVGGRVFLTVGEAMDTCLPTGMA
ncbi:unnamed protein product [Ilex paraguariensis]|uniref:STAS domain-containing protein n=1 Tax=Ilex paraguariensis TaxID=185542 RepID=A0ABC8UXM3_9AQUA